MRFQVFNVNDIYTELRKQDQNPAARAAVKHLREDGYGSSSDDDEGQGDLTPLGDHPHTPCDDDDQPTPKSPSVTPGEMRIASWSTTKFWKICRSAAHRFWSTTFGYNGQECHSRPFDHAAASTNRQCCSGKG